MDLSTLAGNARLKEQLSQRGGGRGLSHAYIISGPAGSGRHTLARILAAAMVCTAGESEKPCGSCSPCKKVLASIHPDVITVAGEGGKPITVDQIRALRSDAHIRPNEGERKLYLLEEADRMRAEAQNAMLKLLEDGPGYAAFLLLADNAGALLQTVRSRCEVLELAPVSPGECRSWLAGRYPRCSDREVEEAAFDCQGILGRAVARLEHRGDGEEERRSRAVELARLLESGSELEVFEAAMGLEKVEKGQMPSQLDMLETELVRAMGEKGGSRRLMRAVELVKQLRIAAGFNTNPGQLAGWLCAGIFSV